MIAGNVELTRLSHESLLSAVYKHSGIAVTLSGERRITNALADLNKWSQDWSDLAEPLLQDCRYLLNASETTDYGFVRSTYGVFESYVSESLGLFLPENLGNLSKGIYGVIASFPTDPALRTLVRFRSINETGPLKTEDFLSESYKSINLL